MSATTSQAQWLRRTIAIVALLFGLTTAWASAQSAPTFVTLGPADAALYKPDSGPAPHVALVLIHRTADYMRHPACTQFAQRGFMALCVNTRFTNNEGLVRFEDVALDVKAAIQFLHTQAAEPGPVKMRRIQRHIRPGAGGHLHRHDPVNVARLVLGRKIFSVRDLVFALVGLTSTQHRDQHEESGDVIPDFEAVHSVLL